MGSLAGDGASAFMRLTGLGQSQSMTSAAMWLLVLIALAVAGAYAIFRVRRKLVGRGPSDAPQGLTLQDLREMKARGDISEAEYERAKTIVVGNTGAPQGAGVNPLTGRPRKGREGVPREGDK